MNNEKTYADQTKPNLIEIAVMRDLVKNKTAGGRLSKAELVTLLAAHDQDPNRLVPEMPEEYVPPALQEPAKSPVEACGTVAGPFFTPRPRKALTKAEKDAKRKKSREKHRRELKRRWGKGRSSR